MNFAKSILDAFSAIVKTSKCKLHLFETDDGNEYVNNFSNKFLRNNHIERYSRYTDKGAVFAERFIKSLRIFLTKPVFEKEALTG